MAAQHLLAVDGDLSAIIGQERLQDRGHQADQIIGIATHPFIRVFIEDVDLHPNPIG